VENTHIEPWRFDKKVAKTFVQHAQNHIPGYDRVIDKSVNFLKRRLNANDAIIDVGCATGETLKRLSQAGFNNLYGVDNSPDMLEQVPQHVARLLCDDRFPCQQKYQAVIMNWTLHFVSNKLQYLTDIWNSLDHKGILILSDKTQNKDVYLELYHDFKRSQGLSEQEIQNKTAQVQDVMHIDSQAWYLKTLTHIGFDDIIVIDADWCFTTFLAIKN
jgi:tRNA (cmo5U34)-methyltransferase